MKSILAVIFLVALLSPLIASIVGVDYDLTENRLPAKEPVFDLSRLLDQNYFAAVDSYFNDSFGLRGALIFAKNWIDYHVFNTSPSRKVHLGREGWIYYRPALNSYQRDRGERRREVESLFLDLHALDTICELAGKQFVFMVAPNKSSIYPEYVGYSFQDDPPDRGPYAVLLDLLNKRPIRTFVRLDERLREAKRNGPVYDRTDTHWNYSGAALVSGELLRAIYGPAGPDLLAAYNLHETPVVRDLTSKMMGLPIEEEVIALQTCEYRTQVSDMQVSPANDPIRHIRHETLPPTTDTSCLMFRDSFSWSLVPFIKGSFRRLDLLPRTGGISPERVGGAINDIDVIVLQSVERDLRGLNIDLEAFLEAVGAGREHVNWSPVEFGDGSVELNGSGDDTVRLIRIAETNGGGSFAVDVTPVDPSAREPTVVRRESDGGSVLLPLPFAQRVSVQVSGMDPATSPANVELVELSRIRR